MSASNAIGDFDLNVVRLRKPLLSSAAYLESVSIEPNPTLVVGDVVSGSRLFVIPSANAENYNPVTQTGDELIVADGDLNGETLTLTSYSETNSGVRIQPTSVTMGAGGELAVPDFYFQSNGGDKNYIKGNCAMLGTLDLASNDIANVSQIEFDDGSVQTTAYTGGSGGVSLVYNNTTPVTTPLTDPAINPSTDIVIHSFGVLPVGMYSLAVAWDLENNQINTLEFREVILTAQQSDITTYPRDFYPNVTLTQGGDSVEASSLFQLSMDGATSLTVRFASYVSSGVYSSGVANFKVNSISLIKLTNTITP